MKKSIALVLAVILLAGILCTALAEHYHDWRLVDTKITTGSNINIAKPNGCIKLSNPHIHWKYPITTKRTYLCFSCQATKQIKTTTYSREHCPKD